MRPLSVALVFAVIVMVVGLRGSAQDQQSASPAPTTAGGGQGGLNDLFSGVGADPAPTTPEQAAASAVEQEPHLATPIDNHQVDNAAQQKIHELTERLVSLQTEVEELKQEVRRTRELERLVAELQQTVMNLGDTAAISRDALGAMSESPQLRGEMAEKLQGKIRLVNNTGAPQVLYINGTAWTVVEGRSFVFAPVGTVSFQRPGQSEPVFRGVHAWSANPQDDRFELTFELQQGDSHVTTPRETSVLQRAAYSVR